MWINRDISGVLSDDSGQMVQIVIGPRQCGKSSLLWSMGKGLFQEVTFDDFQNRTLAQKDPALFLTQQSLPLIIDEVQYVPEIFPEIKKIVDNEKRKKLKGEENKYKIIFRLTGSDQILMDGTVKETLVGRASYFYLNTLSVAEIKRSFPELEVYQIMFKGGWPELYTTEHSTVSYLNDYIRQYIEKDIVLSAGISKQKEFNTILGMLAARTGEILNYSNIAKNSGVKSVTVKEWVSVLERTNLIYLLPPIESNLNKRLTKSPKLYFLDTGIASRLQGWQEIGPMMNSPQAGHIFETLVLAEIVKTINNYRRDWALSVWRTKDGEEVDFVLRINNQKVIAMDAKLGIHSVVPEEIPKAFAKAFPSVQELVLISLSGETKRLSQDCLQVPISQLSKFLLEQ